MSNDSKARTVEKSHASWKAPSGDGQPYFHRKLRALGEPSLDAIQDSDLLSITRSLVILGEPGMGKSEMMSYLARESGVALVSASRFMNSIKPIAPGDIGKPLLIDALDEAMARSDGDAVNKVLARLDDAGCPRFILSCRAREWQSRAERDLKEIYGEVPLIVSIEELTRAEARSFWTIRSFGSDADSVLDRMDAQNLSDFYKNPLMLTLLGEVADSGRDLPMTRAELFGRVCELSWPESDSARQDSALAKLTKDQALSAAGAMMASAILAGAESINLKGAGAVPNGDLAISEVEALPGAAAARLVISSKLFKSTGPDRAEPIHRVIAEFLGAKWLAEQSTTSRACRRLLALFQGGGPVPTSLRGLHAWLAFHSPVLALSVIAADPLGFLRYGEGSALNAVQAKALFSALQVLSRDDPYFRAQDWNARATLGLAHPAIETMIDSAINDPACSFHLRSLILQSIKGQPISVNLSPTLEGIVLAAKWNYAERQAAAEALHSFRDHKYGRDVISKLLAEGSYDSARLAKWLAGEINYDMPDDLLANCLLADLGLHDNSTAKVKDRRIIRLYQFDPLVAALSSTRAKSVLGYLVLAASVVSRHRRLECNQFSELASLLLLRVLRGGQIRPKEAPKLWRWLGEASEHEGYSNNRSTLLGAEMRSHDVLRRAVQRYVIWHVKRKKRLRYADYHLRVRSISISDDPRDVAFFLQEISEKPLLSRRLRRDWQDLVDLGIRAGTNNKLVVGAALAMPHLSMKLKAHLHKAQRPRKYQWQVEDELRVDKLAGELAAQRHQVNNRFESSLDETRRGDLQGVLMAARVYLGLEMWDAGDRAKPPEVRLSEFFNHKLAQEFIGGFEAVLHRSDLPSSKELATSYAIGSIVEYSYPLIAGLLVRVRARTGFKNVSRHVLNAGLLLCMQRGHSLVDEELEALRLELERAVAPTVGGKKDVARTWIEPLLRAGYAAEHDIRYLANSSGWCEAGTSLVSEWLSRFSSVPLATELELIALLLSTGNIEQILGAARDRDERIYETDEKAFVWLAIDVSYRFEEVRGNLAGIGEENAEFIWALRDRMQSHRRGLVVDISWQAAKWVVSEFRRIYPFARLEGVSVGTTNGYDATEFLLTLISQLAKDSGDEAASLIRDLADEPIDSYTDEILHMVAEQRQRRSEENFKSIEPHKLGLILANGPPTNIDDLKSLIMEELEEAQSKLLGDELDQVRDFWSDDDIPYGENRCRDRLAALIDTRLADTYSVKRMTEADMPKDKRADLAFAIGTFMQLPVEVKGQWHDDVWDAASSQLDAKYLIDWRSEGRGIYCVFWFGELKATTGRRLKPRPDRLPAPTSAKEMQSAIIDRIPPARRPFIDVIVIDLITGRKKKA